MRFKLFPELVKDTCNRERDFTQDELERSYNGLYMLFEELLGADPALVILTDGTYRTKFQRDSLREISRRCNVPFVLIKVYATERVILARINERLASGKGSGPESYLSAKAAYEDPSNALLLKNTGNNETLRKKVRTLVPIILQQSTGAS
jgi:predicted kinase